MPAFNELLYIAIADQFRALVKHLTKETQQHLIYCPQKKLACPGDHVEATLRAQDRVQLITLAEVALVNLAELQTAYAELKAKHETMVDVSAALADQLEQLKSQVPHA